MAPRVASDHVINRDRRLSLMAGGRGVGVGYMAQFYSPTNHFKMISNLLSLYTFLGTTHFLAGTLSCSSVKINNMLYLSQVPKFNTLL